jgi:hypothetical protein
MKKFVLSASALPVRPANLPTWVLLFYLADNAWHLPGWAHGAFWTLWSILLVVVVAHFAGDPTFVEIVAGADGKPTLREKP